MGEAPRIAASNQPNNKTPSTCVDYSPAHANWCETTTDFGRMRMRRLDLPMPCRLELLRTISVALTITVNYAALAQPEVYYEHRILSVC